MMTDYQEGFESVSEIAMIGDLTEHESDLAEKLLTIPRGGSCTVYIDCPGGSAYSAMSLLSLITLRRLRLTAIVTGECSSAALWPFAACVRRYVTPFSVFLFHPMKWQSEEHVALAEAAEWARHFGKLESSMDELLAEYLQVPEKQLRRWMEPGKYLAGPELVAAGVADLMELHPPQHLGTVASPTHRTPRRRSKVATS